jgi:hypothetical protein
MKARTFMISMLGWAGMLIPAHATISYYNGITGNTQFNTSVTLAGLTQSASETFGGALGSFTAGNTEYDDTATGIKFFDFRSDGITPDTFLLSGTTLEQHIGGDLLEIILPVNVFAFGANLAFVGASFANVCIEAGVTSFDGNCSAPNQNPLWFSGTEFVGVTSDTAFNTMWIGPMSGFPLLEIANFSDDIGASTPEGQSLILVGTGLVGVGLLKRRMRSPSVERSAQS